MQNEVSRLLGEANALLENKQFQEAFKKYTEVLETDPGNTNAQFELGLMYSHGNGVERNYDEAKKWCRLAAEQGDADAQCFLGVLYNGWDLKNLENDYAEAEKWWRMAAEQGHSAAQYNLGNLYFDGKGVEQSYAEAVKWWHMSAELGCPLAQHSLGFAYERGDGVEQDYTEAIKWYRLSAKQGDADSL